MLKMLKHKSIFLLILLTITLSGCRGYNSEKPALHLNPNLDWQAKFKPQKFTQQPPAGTVAWGDEQSFNRSESRDKFLPTNTKIDAGRYPGGTLVKRIPIPVTQDLITMGQERYDIYCSVCHAFNGEGNGTVVQRGFPPAPDLTSDMYKNKRDGHIYDVIKNGIRNMPNYDKQLSTEEKWAVVAYLRALQQVKSMTVKDLPQSVKQSMSGKK